MQVISCDVCGTVLPKGESYIKIFRVDKFGNHTAPLVDVCNREAQATINLAVADVLKTNWHNLQVVKATTP